MNDRLDIKPATLFVLAVALTVPVAALIVLAGPGAGLLGAGVIAVVVVVVAIRLEPRDWMIPMSRRRPRRDSQRPRRDTRGEG